MKLTKLFIALLLFVAGPSMAATCKVSEYESMVIDGNGRIVPVALEPAIVTQTVTYTTSTELSADLDERTRFVRIICDAVAHYVFSTAGTSATANSPYLPANSPEYFGIARVSPGQTQTLNVSFFDGSS